MTGTPHASDGPHEMGSATRGIEVLRIAMGIIWLLNLIFVVDPANDWFDPSRFAAIAASFAPSTLIGPAMADFIAARPVIFAWLIALMTGYLAGAFLLGVTTRFACLVGFVASLLFLLTQWGTIWSMPGGTDVGAQPLYLAMYVVLFLGGAGRYVSAEARAWMRWLTPLPRGLRRLADPRRGATAPNATKARVSAPVRSSPPGISSGPTRTMARSEGP